MVFSQCFAGYIAETEFGWTQLNLFLKCHGIGSECPQIGRCWADVIGQDGVHRFHSIMLPTANILMT